MNTFLKLEEAYEMEPPKYLLSSFETIDQVIQTLVSVGYERKDDVYKEVPIGNLVVDSAGDGQFRVTRFGVHPKEHPEFKESENLIIFIILKDFLHSINNSFNKLSIKSSKFFGN